MNKGCNINDSGGNNPTNVTACDNGVIQNPNCSDPCAASTCPNFDAVACANQGVDGEVDIPLDEVCWDVWSVTDWYYCGSNGCSFAYTEYKALLGTYCENIDGELP